MTCDRVRCFEGLGFASDGRAVGGVRRSKARFTANLVLEFGGVLAEIVEESRSSGCEVEVGIPGLRFLGKALRKRSDLTQVLVERLPASVRMSVREIAGIGMCPVFHYFSSDAQAKRNCNLVSSTGTTGTKRGSTPTNTSAGFVRAKSAKRRYIPCYPGRGAPMTYTEILFDPDA